MDRAQVAAGRLGGGQGEPLAKRQAGAKFSVFRLQRDRDAVILKLAADEEAARDRLQDEAQAMAAAGDLASGLVASVLHYFVDIATLVLADVGTSSIGEILAARYVPAKTHADIAVKAGALAA